MESVRVEERKARQREVDEVRGQGRERERAIADDLTQLEGLHEERVARLGQQNEVGGVYMCMCVYMVCIGVHMIYRFIDFGGYMWAWSNLIS